MTQSPNLYNKDFINRGTNAIPKKILNPIRLKFLIHFYFQYFFQEELMRKKQEDEDVKEIRRKMEFKANPIRFVK